MSGGRKRKPAIAPSSKICRRICRSGRTSRPAARTASARNAPATRIVSSPACASAPRSPISSSSTITCCAPTPPCGRASSERSSRRVTTRSSTRRTSSRMSRRSTSALSSATTGSTTLRRDVDRAVAAKLIADAETGDDLKDRADRVRDHARAFFSVLQMIRFDGPGVGGGEAASASARPQFEPGRRRRPFPRPRARGARGRYRARPQCAARRAGASAPAPLTCARTWTFFLAPMTPATFTTSMSRGRGVFLRASPIDVSAIVRDLLIDRMTGTVLTSATLTVDGSFEYVRSRLGIRKAREIRLPSEFDYARQAILYLPQTHAGSARARLRCSGGARSDRDREADAGARVRPVYELCQPA